MKALTSSALMKFISVHRGGNSEFSFEDLKIQNVVCDLLREGNLTLKLDDPRYILLNLYMFIFKTF